MFIVYTRSSSVLTNQYMLQWTDTKEAIMFEITAADVKRKLKLPQLAVGDADVLRTKDVSQWDYAPQPFVRNVDPDPEFVEKFKNEGFNNTLPILVVPILSDEEDEAIAKDPKALEELCTRDAILKEDRCLTFV